MLPCWFRPEFGQDPARAFGIALLGLVIAGCASTGAYEIELMPAPEIYGAGLMDPFADTAQREEDLPSGVFYATLRPPAEAEQNGTFYRNDRGEVLTLGVAQIEVGQGEGEMTWEEARRISLSRERPEAYPLRVSAVHELGPLDRTITEFTPSHVIPSDPGRAAERFAARIDAQLARSGAKDVYIYVHGYKVVFDNPILVAAELWHFLGYEGAFVAFSWPATPSRWAYFGDTDTAEWSASGFRAFLTYLAEETDAQRIHIVGYSAGTKMVAQTLNQLALMHHGRPAEDIRRDLKLGQVILIGSDLDRGLFGVYILDGILGVAERLNVYLSEADLALALSRFLYGRARLGEMLDEDNLIPEVREFLTETDDLSLINVTGAEGFAVGGGHAYLRQSPWVSSDILITLHHQLPPQARGLVRPPDSGVWYFPEDYVQRLQESLSELASTDQPADVAAQR